MTFVCFCVIIAQKGIDIMWIIITLFILYGLIQILPSVFATWSDQDYVRHLEDMGVFVDENGKEI